MAQLQEEMDWEEAVHSVMADEGAERLGSRLWYGYAIVAMQARGGQKQAVGLG